MGTVEGFCIRRGTLATAWEDFSFVGDEMGTEAAPFDTVAEGVGFVTASGTINIQPGTTAETITIDKAVTIVNVGTGARGLPVTIVRIGDQSAADHAKSEDARTVHNRFRFRDAALIQKQRDPGKP